MTDNHNIQFIQYALSESNGSVQAVIKDETIWATQRGMAELFGVGIPAISKHLHNIYEEGELQFSATVSNSKATKFAASVNEFLTFPPLSNSPRQRKNIGYRCQNKSRKRIRYV